MIKKYFSCLMLSVVMWVVSVNTLAQKNTFSKEAELEKFVEQGGKYEETAPNIYKLTYRTGEMRVFNFNSAPKQTSYLEGVDTTIINVWEIDTLLYYQKFSFWQKVDLTNNYETTVPIDDVNKNGLLELYGLNEVNFPFAGPVKIFEQNAQGIFKKVYSYDSNSVFVHGIGDINSDGINEIHLKVNDTLNGKFYRVDSLSGLPTSYYFTFFYTPNNLRDETFGDFDNDKITDCVFVDGSNPSKVIISRFNDTINNFYTSFEFVTEGDVPGGFAIGDFDEDGRTEIEFSTVLQKTYVIEVVDTNQYMLIYQGIAPTYNAYMHTSTKDIDGNGKPEFWIGGQDFGDGTSKIMCYEAEGDNNYMPVAYIELRYLVSLNNNYLQSADMDNDGKEELIINIGNYLLILKFTGSPNLHTYNLFYAKINELTQIGAKFLPATIFDFNHDAKMDILIPMDKSTMSTTTLFSYLLIQNTMSSLVEDESKISAKLELFQSYPNPFNHRAGIKFNTDKESFATIKIYNVLGKEIRTLLEKELRSGEYTIEWDGKDSMGNILNSGVYFIQMKANGFQKTIKTILMK